MSWCWSVAEVEKLAPRTICPISGITGLHWQQRTPGIRPQLQGRGHDHHCGWVQRRRCRGV